MKTAIGHPQIFYTVYQKKSSQSSQSSPYFKVIGAYSDIRDAIAAIVAAYRRNPDPKIKFGLESTASKPRHWVHPTKYRDLR